jgi:hypothetical protein
MTELAEDPGGHNLRARYKWRIVGGLVAAMVLNTWLVVRFNGTLARLLGIDPDVPLRDSHISSLAFACFVLLVFVWAVVPVVVYHAALVLVLRARGILPPDAGWATVLQWRRFPSHWLMTEAERQSKGLWSACGFQRLRPGRQLTLLVGFVLAILGMLSVWLVVDAAFMKPVTFDPHRPLWSQWNELIVVGVWLVVITASMLLAMWSAVVIMAGVSLARGQLTAAEALALIRRGRSPKAWTRPEYRAGDRTFGDD